MLRVENERFRPEFSLDSVFYQFFVKSHKNVNWQSKTKRKPGLSDCERKNSVDRVMNALEHAKFRLSFC